MSDLRGRKIGVIGLGKRTGVSLVRYLCAQGATVSVHDDAPREKIARNLAALEGLPFVLDAGLWECDTWVVSPGVPCYRPMLVDARRRGIRTVSELDFAAARVDAPILAVTGTNGKSTTTELAGHILSGWEEGVFVGGNLGTPLIEAAGKRHAFAVVEVSSFQMELTEALSPVAAAILNVSPNHLDRHGNMATYASLKEKLAHRMKAADRRVVVNADDEFCRDMRARIPAKAWTFSRRPEGRADFRVADGRMLTPAGEISLDAFPLLGAHNRENAMAAAGLALAVGCPVAIIAERLATFRGLPHRLQPVARVGDVAFINDSKSTTPESTVRALEAMERPTILIAGGKPKGFSYKPLAPVAAKKAKRIVLFGEAGPEMQRALAPLPSDVVTTLDEAVALARGAAVAGDAVLFSPANASFDQYPGYEARGEHFVRLATGEGRAA